METKKLLISLGTAIAASKLVKSVSSIEMDDVLGTVGLARRRSGGSDFLMGLGLVAAGAVVGAGTALLLAPSTGSETRRRLSDQASKLGNAALDAAREHKDEAMRSISEAANGVVSNHAS
jgi:hypothetical protein